MKPIHTFFIRTSILLAAWLCAEVYAIPAVPIKPNNGRPASVTEGRYKVGDHLVVFAHPRLPLHSEPSTKSAVLTTVPSASRVVVVDATPFQIAHSVQEECGLLIHGHWVKVAYQDTVGYVFDGYLIPHKPRLLRESRIGFWAGSSRLVLESASPVHQSTMWPLSMYIWENGVRETYHFESGKHQDIAYLPKGLYEFAQVYLLATSEELSPTEPRRWTCDCAGKKDWVECKHINGSVTLTIEVDGLGGIIVTEKQ